jgi:hypothetical protein
MQSQSARVKSWKKSLTCRKVFDLSVLLASFPHLFLVKSAQLLAHTQRISFFVVLQRANFPTDMCFCFFVGMVIRSLMFTFGLIIPMSKFSSNIMVKTLVLCPSYQ